MSIKGMERHKRKMCPKFIELLEVPKATQATTQYRAGIDVTAAKAKKIA